MLLCCVCAQATLKPQKSEIKSTFNRYSILHPVRSTVSYRLFWFVLSIRTPRSLIKLPITNGFNVSTPKKRFEMQSPGHFTYAKKYTIWQAQRKHIKIQVSQSPKIGHHETELYRSFLINRREHIVWLKYCVFLCFRRAQDNTYNEMPRQQNRENSVYDINPVKRFIAQIGHIFI